MPTEIRIVKGDITTLDVDAVVNAANTTLLGGGRDEANLLASCYVNSMQLAVEKNLRSIAFPAISTGAYAYPLKEATEIAIRGVRRFTMESEVLSEVVFCCYSGEHFATYKRLMVESSA